MPLSETSQALDRLTDIVDARLADDRPTDGLTGKDLSASPQMQWFRGAQETRRDGVTEEFRSGVIGEVLDQARVRSILTPSLSTN